MRKVLVLLLLLFARPAWCAEAPIQVTVDHPCLVLYSVHGKDDFHPATATPVLRTSFNVDRSLRYDIRVEGSDDFLHHWEGETQDVVAGSAPVNVVTRAVLNGGRAALVGVLGALGLGAGGLLVRKRRPALVPASLPELAPAPTGSVSEAQVRDQLFPPDGSEPTQIASYRVLGHLGTGGMAVVYRVASPSGETLALKLPLPQVWDDPEFRQRFGRELKIAGSLHHPNLVRIMEVNDGSGPFPYPFLVMECVAGRPLFEFLIHETPQPLENIVVVGLQTLAALTHAHQLNVIHRDIKPSNIMITDQGEIRVMDFGVARQTDGTRLTATDEVLGTPMYMAPEQIEGQPVDARTDIYSLATILYEMAAGEPPFADPNYLRLTMMKLREDPPSLQARNPQVDPRLEKCIMRMLSRRPELRPWTAEEAMIDLRPLSPGASRFVPLGTSAAPPPETPTFAVPTPPDAS